MIRLYINTFYSFCYFISTQRFIESWNITTWQNFISCVPLRKFSVEDIPVWALEKKVFEKNFYHFWEYIADLKLYYNSLIIFWNPKSEIFSRTLPPQIIQYNTDVHKYYLLLYILAASQCLLAFSCALLFSLLQYNVTNTRKPCQYSCANWCIFFIKTKFYSNLSYIC